MHKLPALFVVGFGLAAAGPASAEESSRAVTLYKSPQCGCCETYADYLRDNGFSVTVSPTFDLLAMSREAGMADEFQGCHLSFVDGYVVSGHVPVEVVDRLLDERPDILGVTLPGMPTGSPGMGGPKTEPFTIYTVQEGDPKVYAVE